MQAKSEIATNTAPQPAKMLQWVVAVAFFMQMLDGTILNTALPAIALDLGEAPLRMQAAVIAYMLTTALLIPASGWLADRFGTKRIFLAAVFLFTAGSLLCAAADSLPFLVFARVVQGLGGALMVPVGRLIVIKAYPRGQLVQVLSFITIPGLIGPLVGPMAGGFLVQYTSWHWIFLINAPAGVLGLYLAWRHMPDFKSDTHRKFDLSGFLLFGTSMVLVTLSMEGLGELHLPKIQATLLCITGLMLLGAYWLRAARAEFPLFDPHIFGVQTFSVGIIGNLFARLGSGGVPFLVPLFLQLGLGFTPFHAGLTMIPIALAGIAGKSIVTRLIRTMGFRRFLTINTVVVGLTIASFSLVTHETSYIWLLLDLAIFGIFNSMQFTAMNTVTLIDLTLETAGSGNSLLSVTMQVSITCGVAMASALLNGFNATIGGSGESFPVEVFTYTFLCAGLLNAASAIIFTMLPPQSGKQPESTHNEAESTPRDR